MNFVKVEGRGLAVRTFERGVEGETLACGSGVVASAVVAARQGRVSSPVSCSTTERRHLHRRLHAGRRRDRRRDTDGRRAGNLHGTSLPRRPGRNETHPFRLGGSAAVSLEDRVCRPQLPRARGGDGQRRSRKGADAVPEGPLRSRDRRKRHPDPSRIGARRLRRGALPRDRKADQELAAGALARGPRGRLLRQRRLRPGPPEERRPVRPREVLRHVLPCRVPRSSRGSTPRTSRSRRASTAP